MVSAVERHYDERERYGKNDGCAPLRGLLNAVKNTQIVEQSVAVARHFPREQSMKKHILLVGCGHGAQVQFLQQNKFTHIDVYGECVRQACDKLLIMVVQTCRQLRCRHCMIVHVRE